MVQQFYFLVRKYSFKGTCVISKEKNATVDWTSETGGFGISLYSVNSFDARKFDIILSECNVLYDLPHRI